MPAVTVKNIPDKLYKKLKDSAANHRRSINSEIIYCMESMLESRNIDVDRFLTEIEQLQASIKAPPLTEAFLKKAKEAGRP